MIKIWKSINFICCFVWMRIVFSDIKERTWIQSVWEEGAEVNVKEVK
jgi:hypothetical protein